MNSFLSWVGAKTKVAPYIVARFPKEYLGYCEVFGGGGSILFHKEPSPAETYNDINGELVNLFSQVRDNVEELNHLINWTLSSRAEFDRFLSMSPEEVSELDPVYRALRYYFIVKNSFGSNPASGSFSSCQTTRIRWNCLVDLTPYRDRLRRVTIENMEFAPLIKKYDNDQSLIYCVPSGEKIVSDFCTPIEIGELEDGSKILGDNIVNKKFKRISERETIRKIYYYGGGNHLPSITSLDHKILSYVDGNMVYVKSEDIEVGDKICISTDDKIEDFNLSLVNIPSNGRKLINYRESIKSLCKILGYFAAEGHYQHGLVFSFGPKELHYCEEVKNLVEEVFGISPSIREKCPHPTSNQVYCPSGNLAETFSKLMTGTACEKKFSKEVMRIDPIYQIEIIKCWLNGDGGIESFTDLSENSRYRRKSGSRNKFKITGTTCSESLAIQMYNMALRCRLSPCINKRENNWDVYFTTLRDAKILYGLGTNGRNCPRRRWIGDYLVSQVTKIEEIEYSGEMIDISTSNGNFNLLGGVVCHNCDPPYYVAAGKRYYEFDFGEEQHLELFNALKDMEGKFVVSYDDVPEVREMYKDFNITLTEPMMYTLSSGSNTRKRELLIFNYEPESTGQMDLFV